MKPRVQHKTVVVESFDSLNLKKLAYNGLDICENKSTQIFFHPVITVSKYLLYQNYL